MNGAAARETERPGGALATIAALWLLAFSGACRLGAAGVFAPPPGEGVVARVLGSVRVALAGRCFETADRYFHRGVGHRATVAFHDPLARFAAVLTPREHVHAEGGQVLDIMPWLRFTTELAPHDVDAYLVAAYWADRAGAPRTTVEGIYGEARRNNPGDYRVLLDWGRYEAGRAPVRAIALLEAGRRLWPRGVDDADHAALDRAALDEWLACLYGQSGRTEEALSAVADAIACRPPGTAAEGLRELARAGAGGDPAPWRSRLAQLRAPPAHHETEEEEEHEPPGACLLEH